MGVRRVYQNNGTLTSVGNYFLGMPNQSNKKILIERIFLIYTTSATSSARRIQIGIGSLVNTNISWYLLDYETSSVSTSFVFGIAIHPLANNDYTALIQLTYPLIISPNDQLYFSFNYGTSTSDTYSLLVEYLEMDLDEEIWQ